MIKILLIAIAVLALAVFVLFKITRLQSKKLAEAKLVNKQYEKLEENYEELTEKIKTGIEAQDKLNTGSDTTNFNNSIDILHELSSRINRQDAGY